MHPFTATIIIVAPHAAGIGFKVLKVRLFAIAASPMSAYSPTAVWAPFYPVLIETEGVF